MSNLIMRVKDIYRSFWWRFVKGLEIKIDWPISIEQNTADPNEIYRSWLKENVGCQLVNWDWRISSVTEGTIVIKFRKIEHAMLFALMKK